MVTNHQQCSRISWIGLKQFEKIQTNVRPSVRLSITLLLKHLEIDFVYSKKIHTLNSSYRN